MNSGSSCLLAIIFVLFALGARADEILATPAAITQSPAFVRYLEDRLVRDMGDVARQWDAERGAACSGDVVLTPLSAMEVIRPVTMADGQLAPVSGVWGMVSRVERCGRAVVYRMQIEIRPGQPRRILRIVPGETTINNSLMRQVLPPMMDAARRAADKPDCRAITLRDTYLLERTADYGVSPTDGLARERWWFRVCDSDVAIDADFFPDPAAPGRMTFALRPARAAGAYVLR